MNTPIKILALTANPSDKKRLGIDEEVRKIDQCIRSSAPGGAVRFAARFAVRLADLRDALREEEPDVLHFSGHGARSVRAR